jgi:DNA-binding NarL/FixJ family response regulator
MLPAYDYLGSFMRVLLITSNSLFAETISVSIQKTNCADFVCVSPNAAAEAIAASKPEVIMFDEACLASCSGELIWKAAQELSACRIVLLNLHSNDIVILDAWRATIHHLNDLLKVLQPKMPLEFPTESLSVFS